ncbi:prepilin-type N-terminal cleavage/methylation domain-containing protein [uncultured Luteimonas sp.]|uniref:prepilin-type N-terminal cleavage/methylation domain-containing protein n=1 Tax=uncultured Luteimonas sp. TaxID=453144 RepID=UPI002630BA64|nr:prepilin-type N-terminal cleavage/methylation domain-containing protein [uncultured Luteimonas sp.]
MPRSAALNVGDPRADRLRAGAAGLPPCSRGLAGQAGFTLLEAIVAMVIMATTMLALYAWLGSATIGVQRARSVAQGLADARVALAVIEGINPMDGERGSRDVGDLTVRWSAETIADRRAGVTSAGVAAPYDFALYDIEVETLRDGRQTYAFNVRRAGWVATQVLSIDDL